MENLQALNGILQPEYALSRVINAVLFWEVSYRGNPSQKLHSSRVTFARCLLGASVTWIRSR